MSSSFNFERVLRSVVKKAEEDNVITPDEKALLEEIKVEGKSLQEKIDNFKKKDKQNQVLQRVLSTSSKVLLKNLISKARVDGNISQEEKELLEVLFQELGFDLSNFESRPWYNFKICINIDEKTPINQLLDYFDKVFCLRGIDPTDVYAGLCLGTKHYVIEDVDVTLLTFALTPKTTQEWVKKGAFATLEYGPNFDRKLYNTAHDLIVENYLVKL